MEVELAKGKSWTLQAIFVVSDKYVTCLLGELKNSLNTGYVWCEVEGFMKRSHALLTIPKDLLF